MCEQCLAQVEVIGQVVPGIFLVQATKKGLLMSPGDFGFVESADPFYVFSQVPSPDPDFGLSDEEIDTLPYNAEADKWQNTAEKFCRNLLVDPIVGWRLVQACIECGYNADEHGYVGFWLFHKAGEIYQQWTNKR